MRIKEVLKSQEDSSVNFVFDNWLEARFVRRVQDYFIVYLSSHDGCNKSCRFCHLTQTKQTSFNEATLEDYLTQAQTVLNYYDEVKNMTGVAKVVHFNFMARGEPLANSIILENSSELFQKLEELAIKRNLKANFNISTIFPEEMKDKDLTEIFKNVKQSLSIYYSLYSVNESFRKRWIPKSLDYNLALSNLEKLQKNLSTNITFHWAFIEGQNDSPQDLIDLKNTLSQYHIKAKFNLVRYNPYSISQGNEPKEEVLQYNFDELNKFFNNTQSRIVPRVGFDVKASCGMFVSQD